MEIYRYKINREPEITTRTGVDDETNVVQNYRRKSRLTLLEEPPEQFSISTPNTGRGFFEGTMCKCRNGRLRMDSNGDLHCDYCGFTDIANSRKMYFQASGPIIALSSPERSPPVPLFDNRLFDRRPTYKERMAAAGRGSSGRRFNNDPNPAPTPVPSLLKMGVNDRRSGAGARTRMKNFYDETLKVQNGRKDKSKFGRRPSSIESNVGSDKSLSSDGGADQDKDNTKRRPESPNTDKKDMSLEQEMTELNRKVKLAIGSKYVGNSSCVAFLCGFYCKICRKMITGNLDDIMVKHGSPERHDVVTKPESEDTLSKVKEEIEDDSFDIRFDDDGCLLISKLDDDVENYSNVDIQSFAVGNGCDSSTNVIDNEEVSAGKNAKNNRDYLTDDEHEDGEREEGEAMDDDENEDEFEDISEDREKTPEPSRRRRRYDRTSSRRY